jgi:uncharacterized membrane protein YdjX (TVP38/TMEM64 family)
MPMMKQATEPHREAAGESPGKASQRLRRWLPALALLLLIAGGYALGLNRHLSLTALAENRDSLRQWVDANLALALTAYALLYFAVVALSIPGAAIMSISGGFLFGWAISAPVTVVAAAAGAAAVFQIVKTSFGAALAEKAGPFLQRLSRGFAENAFSLLLFLRLTPVFPFWAVNAVAGLCRIPLRTFVLATAIGIIPASVAFALVGSGLDRVIDAQRAAYAACIAAKGAENCSFTIEASALLSPELGLGLTGLGIVALIPLGVRLWKGRAA